ncbi:MAG: hypothetical protein PHS41_04700, partial [Victivallaceae bacterium]|nr:hypothetical protein [Victivallaceae bacterium]
MRISTVFAAILTSGAALICGGCIGRPDAENPEAILRTAALEEKQWPSIHAAEGLAEANLQMEEVARHFEAERSRAQAQSPWRVGCLRVLYQYRPEQRADLVRELEWIAGQVDSPGVVHAVESMVKLSLPLSSELRQKVTNYAAKDDMLGRFSLILLTQNNDRQAQTQLLALAAQKNETALFGIFYLDRGTLTSAQCEALLAIARDSSTPPKARAFAWRGALKHLNYPEQLQEELLAALHGATDLQERRFLILAAGDYQ